MPRSETVISVFVASPSDVTEERTALESVINELNKIWSKNLGLRLDLIKWETDVHPDFGRSPQDVINSQINDEYDIFIAIFWGRIGSPTKEFESGTLEEFDRAYKKYKRNKSSINIMVYFKDQPIAPSKIDMVQMAKIQELRSTLGDKGGLCGTFENIKDFESLLRANLSQVAQEWSVKISSKVVKTSITESGDNNPDIEDNFVVDYGDDDYGLLDYVEIYENRMSDMTSSLTSIAEATQKIGQQFNRRTEELKLLQDGSGNFDQRNARKVIKMSSNDIERFSEILESQTNIMSKSRGDSFEALSKWLAMYVDFHDEGDEDNLQDLEESLASMSDSALLGIEGLCEFKASISNLPKLTIELNKSKRRAIKLLDVLLEEIRITIQTSGNVMTAIKRLRDAE